MIASVSRVLREGPLSSLSGEGPPRELENAFRHRFDVAFAVSSNSGTSALLAALFAAGVQPGDEVIAPALAPAYAMAVILHFRALPVLADVDPLTLTIDPASVEERLGARTKAIIAVDLSGHPTDLDGLRRIVAGSRITIIEDCAQAFGAEYRGKPVGHVREGEIACFSLQESKNLSGGEGGMLLTQDRESFERACLVGQHPARLYEELKIEYYRRYWETGLGLSLRIHPVAAAIALAALEDVDDALRARRENAAYLNERLAGLPGLSATYVAPGCVHAYNVHPFFYDPPAFGRLPVEEFVATARARGLDLDVFPDPIYETALFRRREFFGLGGSWEENDRARGLYDRDSFPGAEAARRRAVFFRGGAARVAAAGVGATPGQLDWVIQELNALTKIISQKKET